MAKLIEKREYSLILITCTILLEKFFFIVPGHVCCESHSGEGPNGLVGQVQRKLGRRVQDVGNHLKECPPIIHYQNILALKCYENR